MVYGFPKITKKVPSTLVGIALVSVIAAFGLDTRTVGDLSSVQGKLPVLHLPQVPLTLETLTFVFPYALILAMVGLIETLMTLQLVDEVTDTRGKGNREALALGAANVIAGAFKGMGGCALVGESLINIGSGGRGRMSGVFAALALLAFMLFGAPLIDRIPIAALTGVMFVVVIATFEWASFRMIGKIHLSDLLVITAVTLITVWRDLAIAVVVGVILSALVFAWKSSKHIHLNIIRESDGERFYGLEGLLYFGSVRDFLDQFKPTTDPERVVVDFAKARICDLSGMEALRSLSARYDNAGKILEIQNLSPDCQQMLSRLGLLSSLTITNAVSPEDGCMGISSQSRD